MSGAHQAACRMQAIRLKRQVGDKRLEGGGGQICFAHLQKESFPIKSKKPKVVRKERPQNVSRSGRPYPNIVHNVQSPALK